MTVPKDAIVEALQKLNVNALSVIERANTNLASLEEILNWFNEIKLRRDLMINEMKALGEDYNIIADLKDLYMPIVSLNAIIFDLAYNYSENSGSVIELIRTRDTEMKRQQSEIKEIDNEIMQRREKREKWYYVLMYCCICSYSSIDPGPLESQREEKESTLRKINELLKEYTGEHLYRSIRIDSMCHGLSTYSITKLTKFKESMEKFAELDLVKKSASSELIRREIENVGCSIEELTSSFIKRHIINEKGESLAYMDSLVNYLTVYNPDAKRMFEELKLM